MGVFRPRRCLCLLCCLVTRRGRCHPVSPDATVRLLGRDATPTSRESCLVAAHQEADQCLDRSAVLGNGNWWHLQNFALAALDQTADMTGPQRQCRAYLALVGAAIIDASDTALVATLMVEHGLDNVRLNSEVGPPGGDGGADIVQVPPDGKTGGAIEPRFALAPIRKATAGASAE